MLIPLPLAGAILAAGAWGGIWQFPPIPDTVKSEALVAVLFLVVIFTGLVVLLARALPAVVQSFRSPVTPPSDLRIEGLREDMREIKANQVKLLERMERIEDSHIDAIRRNLHDIREYLIVLESRLWDQRGPSRPRPREKT